MKKHVKSIAVVLACAAPIGCQSSNAPMAGRPVAQISGPDVVDTSGPSGRPDAEDDPSGRPDAGVATTDAVTDVGAAQEDAGGTDGSDVAALPPGVVASDYLPLIACPTGLEGAAEVEPNDDYESIQDFGTATAPGLCVQGALLCGNDGSDAYSNDNDFFVFDVPAGVEATVTLRWDAGATDMDKFLLEIVDASTAEKTLAKFEQGASGLETATIPLQGKPVFYVLQVGCWESSAPGAGYALSVAFSEPPTGTDGTDTSGGTDGTDTSGGTDGTDGTDTTDGTGSTDGTTGTDTTDGTGATDGTTGTDGT